MHEPGVILIPDTCKQAPTSRRQAADVAAKTYHQHAQRAEPVRVPKGFAAACACLGGDHLSCVAAGNGADYGAENIV